ncbi:unannotated protein [freshwater metagenome]|uniref:Unannotated protein n=1 Tax=freshwater metagenome TaxID=449393 RepID=A0A6J7DJZ5_9ZZZZ
MTGPRPLIGIVAAVERCKWTVWDQNAAVVAANYLTSVSRAGGVPVILPVLESSPELIDRHLDAVDAIVLAGGSDVDPSLYGAELHPHGEDTDRPRDDYEIPLALRAVERGIPLLGICRGMQILNVALGGTLHQDLLVGDRTGFHRPLIGDLENSLHDVQPVSGTLTERIMSPGASAVASHHHQAVDTLGSGLQVGATSENDGCCEAIELVSAGFAVGVQWHAEATPGDTFFEALVAAV